MASFGSSLWNKSKSGFGSAVNGLKKAGSAISSGASTFAKSSVGQSLAAEFGNVSKAVIEIADFSERKVTEENAKKPGGGAGISGLSGFSGGLAQNYMQMERLSSKLNEVTGALGDGGDDEEFEILKNYQKFRFEVPFNPSELTFTGYGGEEMAVQNFSTVSDDDPTGEKAKKDPNKSRKGPGNQIKQVDSHIEMNIPLIFDKTNVHEAFYADKFSLGATNLAKEAFKVGKDALGAGDYSVQAEVEAFTSIIRSKERRLIHFTWGDMSYEGILNSVSAEYTMFNVSGEPCRAKVNLRLVLLDGDYADTSRIWRERYTKRLNVQTADSLLDAADDLLPSGQAH
ncbi:MAG: hypothetical protein K6G12_02530 [Lachnospiraceae bacterium]|nr:hypothetical protein [Lachnospiraceae bacterium]